jgi:hypothetical protein
VPVHDGIRPVPDQTRGMKPRVLVVGKDRGLGDLLDVLLLDRASVTWVSNPDDTEGLGVVAVVVDETCGPRDLKQLAVHPGLRGKPIISLGPNDPGSRNIALIDTQGSQAVEDIMRRLDPLIVRVGAQRVAESVKAS